MFINYRSYNKRKDLQFTDFLKSAKNVCKSTIYKDFTAPRLLISNVCKWHCEI